MQKQRLKPRPERAYVYSDFFSRKHYMLGSCRIMCIGSFDPKNATSSNPHQLTWSQLQARKNPAEPFEHVVIGGLALVMLFLGMAFV